MNIEIDKNIKSHATKELSYISMAVYDLCVSPLDMKNRLISVWEEYLSLVHVNSLLSTLLKSKMEEIREDFLKKGNPKDSLYGLHSHTLSKIAHRIWNLHYDLSVFLSPDRNLVREEFLNSIDRN